MLRIAINGYGRIGRNVHRQMLKKSDTFEVVAINSRANAEMRAHLLEFDSLHGHVNANIEVNGENMVINGKVIHILKERDPEHLPWKDLNIDIVIEATGLYRTKDKARRHIIAGARKVIVSAPMKDDTPTFVKGVNEHLINPDQDVISNASCTTNSIAPPLMVLNKYFGIEKALISTIHAFTDSQNLLDNSGEDLRRARSAVCSIIPTTTGSVKAIGLILPELNGKVNGMAFRVPVMTSSCSDMSILFKRNVTAEEINNVLIQATREPRLRGILGVSEKQLVSIDFKTDTHSSIIDLPSTKVVGNNFAQVVVWYDNEWAYATRLTEMVEMVGNI